MEAFKSHCYINRPIVIARCAYCLFLFSGRSGDPLLSPCLSYQALYQKVQMIHLGSLDDSFCCKAVQNKKLTRMRLELFDVN